MMLFVPSAPLGISFLEDRKMFNTIASHRLFEFVKKRYDNEVMDKLTDNLLRSYFSEGKVYYMLPTVHRTFC